MSKVGQVLLAGQTKKQISKMGRRSARWHEGVMIPIGTHPEAVAGTLTMETIAFSVRPPMMSKDEARPDRGGSKSGFGRGHLDFISMAMNMARPHTDNLEAMPTRPPKASCPGESQAARNRNHGFGSERYLGSINRFPKSRPVSARRGRLRASDTMTCYRQLQVGVVV